MLNRLFLLASAVVILTGCGTNSGSSGTTTRRAEHMMTVSAYFLRDNKVATVHARVPQTRPVAEAALTALFGGPPAGLETALPSKPADFHLSVSQDGTADLSLQPSPDLSRAARAQIVYTLTQFRTVHRVRLNRTPIGTRADYEDETPLIFVESPAPGDAVTSPIRAHGTANTFEATLQLRLVQNGTKLYEHFVTATSGNGQRGTFSWEIPFEVKGAATLEAFEYSAEDGSEIHKVRIPIELA